MIRGYVEALSLEGRLKGVDALEELAGVAQLLEQNPVINPLSPYVDFARQLRDTIQSVPFAFDEQTFDAGLSSELKSSSLRKRTIVLGSDFIAYDPKYLRDIKSEMPLTRYEDLSNREVRNVTIAEARKGLKSKAIIRLAKLFDSEKLYLPAWY